MRRRDSRVWIWVIVGLTLASIVAYRFMSGTDDAYDDAPSVDAPSDPMLPRGAVPEDSRTPTDDR